MLQSVMTPIFLMTNLEMSGVLAESDLDMDSSTEEDEEERNEEGNDDGNGEGTNGHSVSPFTIVLAKKRKKKYASI